MNMLLQRLLLTIITIVSSVNVFSQDNIASHPRLLLKADEEKKIEKMINEDVNMALVHNAIIDYCNKAINEPPVEHVLQGKRLLAKSNLAFQRVFYLSYAYRLTNNERYLKRAEKELITVCKFKDWNPQHFLDVADMLMAVSIGYDWLYDALSKETLDLIEKAIIEKGFTPAKDDRYNGFYKRTNNWNQVCNAGLVMGALAIYEKNPKLSQKIIKSSVESVPLAMEAYGPDGAYQEGSAYWGYGTGYEAIMISALESALDTDYGLTKDKNFMKSAYFLLYTLAPSGKCYNYSDAGSSVGINQALFWFAKKIGDSSLLWFELPKLNEKKNHLSKDRLLPNILINAKDIAIDEIKKPSGNFWFSRGIKPLYVYRSGWDNPDDTYLGIVGGSAKAPHGHMDAGSFVFEKNGVRWSMELGLQSYYSLEKEGVDLWNSSQNGQRWDVFRYGNTGHSTLTINGKHHLVDGNPPIVETYMKDNLKGAKVDLSSIFSQSVKSSIRKITLDKDDVLNIEDVIETNDSVADVMWVMVTPAEATILNKNQILLKKDGKEMIMTVHSELPVEMNIWDNKPVHYYDQDNPGTLRVGFKCKLPSNSKNIFNVELKDKE